MRARFFIVIAAGGLAATLTAADDPVWTQSVERAALEYNRELVAATQELVAARTRVATERLPFEERQREWHDKIISFEARIARLESEQSQAGTRLNQLQAEVAGLHRNLTYVASLGKEGLDSLKDALLPGEAATLAAPIAELASRWEHPAHKQDATIAVEAAGLIMQRLRAMIGGHLAPGRSLIAGDNELAPGTFLWVGPEVFFRADRDGSVGIVHQTDSATEPVTHLLPLINPSAVDGLFRGGLGSLPVDPSGGKALRLQEVRGTWIDHIRLGGPIGYIIIALGALAATTALLKIFDLRHLAVDSPERVKQTLDVIATQPPGAAELRIATLHPAARELLRGGLAHLHQSKEALEENLYATLLRLRMRFERRLPFLTVIVAAAPLLGLLGTVTGMVKTFTLITVFGTGNAAKLSSGISEALVTTELGLIVAIPTLVVHGYLSRRTQLNLALLERYAADFVAMVTVLPPTPTPTLPAAGTPRDARNP